MDIREGSGAKEEIEEKNRCKNDLKYLCTKIFGYQDWDTIHDEMQEFMDKAIVRDYKGRQYVLMLVPRGHLKSCVITKGWAVQQMLRNHNIRILMANAIWDHARGFLRTIMQYLGVGGKLENIFGPFFPKDKIKKGIKWSADEITINQRTVPQDAASIATTGVERSQTSQHYDVIILDDVVVRENINTPEQRNKVKKFYNDCIDLLEPNGIMVVVGTTWHQDDLYSTKPPAEDDDKQEFRGLLYDRDFKIFVRIAEKGNQESVLFKKKYSFEELMRIKDKKGPYEYSAQYLLNPYPEEDKTFRSNWVRSFKYEGEPGHADAELHPDDPLFVAITIDPSLGKEKSNYAGVVATGIDLIGRKFVLEAKRIKKRVELFPIAIVEMVLRLREKKREVNVIGLEYFGFQQSLLKPIKEALKKASLDVRVELLPTVNNSKEGVKETRILGLVPDFSSYEVYVHLLLKNLREELRQFNPIRKSKYDDLLDALAWSKCYWRRRPKKIPTPKYKEGTLGWLMNRRAGQRPDIFWEFRDKTEAEKEDVLLS